MARQVIYSSLNRGGERGRWRTRAEREKREDEKFSLKTKLYIKINSEWTADLNVAIKFLETQQGENLDEQFLDLTSKARPTKEKRR